MSLEVIICEEATFDARFYTAAGVPVDPSGTPTYRIIDQNQDFIISGTGTQDPGAPERWLTMIMIPEGALATNEPDEYYLIMWRLVSISGETYNFTERFKVYTGLREDEPPVEAVFGIEGISTVSDMIVTDVLPYSYSYKIVDPFGLFTERNTVPEFTSSPIATRTERGNYYFRETIDVSHITFTPLGIEEVQIHWTINFPDGEVEHEIHPCFLATNYAMKLVFDVRQKIDKGQQWQLNSSLNISDWEVIFSLIQAMDRINSSLPITEWAIGTLPASMRYFLTGYATVELLRQLYLAYGLAAFDFQGQSTQLSMDATQYIQTVLDSMESSLNERLVAVKKNAVRQSRPVGVLSVNLGPSTNYPNFMDPGSNVRFRLRGYLFRGSF